MYICKNSPDCREKAEKRRALERAFSMAIEPEIKKEIFAQLAAFDDAADGTDAGKGQDA